MKVEGLTTLKANLERLAKKSKQQDDGAVIVGYTQSYAVPVHEKPASHKVGQWKYLETPAREMSKTIQSIVAEVVARGKSLLKGLLVAGLRLQRESQQIVPVDTTALRASAFTAIESEADAAAAIARAKSDAVRSSKLVKRAEKRAKKVQTRI
jgi:hypothetical protein